MLRKFRGGRLSLGLLLWLLVVFAQAAAVPGQPTAAPLAKPGAAPTPEALSKILSEAAGSLEKDLVPLAARLESYKKDLDVATKDLQELKARMAALKASVAVKELPVAQAQETVKACAGRLAKALQRQKELHQEQEKLQQEQAYRARAAAILEQEVGKLRQSASPVTRSRSFQESFKKYQQLAKEYHVQSGQSADVLARRLELLGAEIQVLSEARDQFSTYVEKTWPEELLKRESPVRLGQQVGHILQTLGDLPARLNFWLFDLVQSGTLLAILSEKLGTLLGLLAFLVALTLATRRLQAAAAPALQKWLSQVDELGLQALLSIAQITVARLPGVTFMVWLYLAGWSLDLLKTNTVWVVFSALAAWLAFRLLRRMVQAIFAGARAGGILPLDDQTARFFRRHLQLLGAYILFPGLVGLNSARAFGFSLASLQFLSHLMAVGLLGWAYWLLRCRYLSRLLSELTLPNWLRRPELWQGLQYLVLLILTVILIGTLLGFQNLSAYVAKATAATGVILVLLWLLWQFFHTLLYFALHPDKGLLGRQDPSRAAALEKSYKQCSRLVLVVLVALAAARILAAWGVPAGSLAWAFQWLNYEIALGPLQLTLLKVGLAALAVYGGLWFSRLSRGFLEARFYPRTDWDTGVQYTISASLHYTILIITGLLALNLIGFPLANLALVAGALGVGIGFGLQNIVNNFISGLILLFERPIKAGGLLVIDGKWGTVQEIRVRSTVFQTQDKAVLIIPNSELLSGKILNWTHAGGGVNRLTLKVGVSYEADVRQVTQILLEVCRSSPRVLTEPPPQVFFEAYGDSSLNFNVWVHLNTPQDRVPATHELNTAIFEACAAHGIQIPFSQRELYIKNWPAGFASRPG